MTNLLRIKILTKRGLRLFYRVAIFSLVLLSALPLRAEFPALKRAMAEEIELIAKQLELKSVLVAIDESVDLKQNWNLNAAIETEIVSLLKSHKIDATDNDCDERYHWFRRSNAAAIRRFQKAPQYDRLLTATFSKMQSALVVEVAVFDQENSKPVAKRTFTVSESQKKMNGNIPELNRAVLSYVSERRGRAIGDGLAWTAAKDALANAKARQIGMYDFGRRLGPDEAIMPGDILQFEKSQFHGKHHKQNLNLEQHTAIVGDVLSNSRLKILHQNQFGNDKRVIETRVDLEELRQGQVVTFRPTNDDAVLPRSMLPYRKLPPKILFDSNGAIDLLRTVELDKDTVSGIWNRLDGVLTSHVDRFCKLQFPIDVPKSYVLNATIKRIGPGNAFVLVFVIDGRQVMLTIDGYRGDKTFGIGLVDGRKASINETTGKKNIFVLNQPVQLQLSIEPGHIIVTADDEMIIDWKGDTSRLKLNPLWASPSKDWIHIGGFMAEFEITKFTLKRKD